MATYQTPGVYIEEVRKLPASVAAVETAIPVFIGHTEKAPSTEPVRVTSLIDYQQQFGAAKPHGFTVEVDQKEVGGKITERTVSITSAAQSNYMMYYAVQSFYANGGGDCYVLSTGDYSGTDANTTAMVTAIPQLEKVDRPTLLVFPDKGTIAAFKAVYDAALAHCAKMQDRFVIMDVKEDGTDPKAQVASFRSAGISTSNLNYGAAYYPSLKTSLPLYYDESAVEVQITTNGALAGGPHPKVDSFNASDPPLYRTIQSKLGEHTATVTASGAVAGVYARTDRERGVWKAPANASLLSVLGPSVQLTKSDNDTLNIDTDAGKSVNAIRKFTGKGTLVWGARTLAGNDNEWRYVPVRRLFIFVEESIKKATEFVVFEPNDANTWLRTKAMIESFLTTLWRQGAFQGATTQEAFYVSVGLGTTMSQDDILNGIMNIEIGLAAVRPAEFIVLKFSHFIQQS